AVDIIAGSNVTVTTNANKRSFTIAATGGGSGIATNGGTGLGNRFTNAVTAGLTNLGEFRTDSLAVDSLINADGNKYIERVSGGTELSLYGGTANNTQVHIDTDKVFTTSPTTVIHGNGGGLSNLNSGALTVTISNFVIGTRYTNAPTMAFVAASFQLNAAVAGTAAVTLFVEQPGIVTNKLSVSAGPLASLTTIEPLSLPVSASAVYYFNDVSSGSGATATIVAGTSSVTYMR